MDNLMVFLGVMLVLSQAVEKIASLIKFWKIIKKILPHEGEQQLPFFCVLNFVISFIFIGFFVPIDALEVLSTGKVAIGHLNIGVFLSILIASMGSAFVSDLLEIMKGAAKEKSKFAQVSS